MNPMKIIGKGKISTVFSDGVFAYKTYPKDFLTTWIEYEYAIHQTIYNQTQLPLIKYDYIKEERLIKMDLIHGITLVDRMRKQKYKKGLEDLVQLQLTIYDYEDLPLPNAFEVFRNQIHMASLPSTFKEKALESLNQLEIKKTLCHLDFHPENILFDGEKYILIDWTNAKVGNPLMDVARTYIILQQYAFRLSNKYLKIICKSMRIRPEEVKKAIPLMAFLRLLEQDARPFKEELESMILRNNS